MDNTARPALAQGTADVRQYMAPFEHSPAGVLLMSADGRIFAANPAACRMLGYTSEQLCSLGRAGLMDATDPAWELALADRERDKFYRRRLRFKRSDGSTLAVDASSSTFTDDGTERAIVLFEDASEVADALALAAQKSELAEVVMNTLESISDGYVALAPDWTVTYLNRHALTLLDVDRQDIVGRNVWDALPLASGTEFQRNFEHAMTSGQTVTFEGYYIGSQLRCEVRAYRLKGGGLAIYLLDVSARFEVERERERRLAAERDARAAAERAQVELSFQAEHDDLTGLLNRPGLRNVLERAATANPTQSLAVLYIDLDRFKLINDTLGHGIGDEFLAAFAQQLRQLAGAGTLLARHGGDEFIVAMPGASRADASAMAYRIVSMSAEPLNVEGNALMATASVGIARAERNPDVGQLLREADVALYAAKDDGRERAAWFDEDLHAAAVDRMRVEQDLRKALAGDELTAHYQPAYDLRTGAAADVEALVRWQHPERGMVSPGAFIPVAEDSGLILPLGNHVMRTAIEQTAAWAHVPDVRVWVNVSTRQLAAPGLADRIAGHLELAGVPAWRFGIEVTESMLAEGGRMTSELRAVHDLGVAIAIDDFGTGYSSLARLTKMPVDLVKIDRSFVADLGTPTGDALLEGIVTLGHSIGAKVTAEGVETAAQLRGVIAAGCDTAAGYYLQRPGPAAAARWVADLAQLSGALLVG